MPGPLDNPLLHQRLAVGIHMQRSRVGMAVRDLPSFLPHTKRQLLHCLRNDRVGVTGIDGGIPFTMKNDGRHRGSLVGDRFGCSPPRCIAAKADGMSRAAPQANPECTPIAA